MKTFVVGLFFAFSALPLYSQEPAKPKEIIPKEALIVKSVGQGSRSPVHTDPVEAELVAGKWKAPKAGDQIRNDAGVSETWSSVEFRKDGAIQHKALQGGYAYVPIAVEEPGVWMLDAAGHGMVYVNGEPRAGDPYSHGYVSLPIYLSKGTNHLLFLVARGQLRVKLTEPKGPLFLSKADALVPDFLVGEDPRRAGSGLGAVVVVNASLEPVKDVAIETVTDDKSTALHPVRMPALTVRKNWFGMATDTTKAGSAKHAINLVRTVENKSNQLDSISVDVAVKKPDQQYRRTFTSQIDDSVQYYAVNPACKLKEGETPALFLTLHGANVEASGQAAAYPCKEWGHLVAPTNRRSFGFDWEDWGRLDALEVLELAKKELKTDPKRTYLTGHSMGGHGTWHLGVTHPDQWAAIGPSAGWMSFWTYGSGPRKKPSTPVEEMFYRANNGSDTALLASNLTNLGVYVLHGDADDNVPVDQARAWKKILDGFHKDFEYHEQPKAGHWWGGAKEGGCVDWKPMFELFVRRSIPGSGEVRGIDFTTANPGVSSTYHWLEILAQAKPLELSNAKFEHNSKEGSFAGTTSNVARLSIDLAHLKTPDAARITIDGHEFKDLRQAKGDTRVYFEKQGEKWRTANKPGLSDKGPHRYGPFRDAFRNRMVFVVGTKGSPAETAWAWAKARYDAETWWYRANGSVDVVADVDFRLDGAKDRNDKDRSIILYGNADTHALWKDLVGGSPVQVQRGKATIGKRVLEGNDMACMFLRPRPGSDFASIGVISGTGLPGLRLTYRMPIFISGMAYPDCFVADSSMLTKGYAGVLAAGYFGLDWSVEAGDFAWRK